MNLSDLNAELAIASKEYQEALVALSTAISLLAEAKIKVIQADSSHKRFTLECRAKKARFDELMESCINTRMESRV